MSASAWAPPTAIASVSFSCSSSRRSGADPFGEVEGAGQGDHDYGDEPQVAGASFDLVAEDEADHADRNRRQNEVPPHPILQRAADRLIEVPEYPGRDSNRPRRHDLQQLSPEVQHDRRDGAELDHRRERSAGIRPPEQRRHDAQMCRRGDRKELGQSLDDAENRGLSEGEIAPGRGGESEWVRYEPMDQRHPPTPTRPTSAPSSP